MAEAMDDESKDSKGEIDEGLYSRQLYVMGREGQRRMATSDVLLIGLDGVGVEVAKNVILAGVKSVTLLDDTPASWMDMGAQFYVSEASLGKPRWATFVDGGAAGWHVPGSRRPARKPPVHCPMARSDATPLTSATRCPFVPLPLPLLVTLSRVTVMGRNAPPCRTLSSPS
jgi:hypothetical protein